MELKISEHARKRAQQRNITFEQIKLVYHYGTSINNMLGFKRTEQNREQLKYNQTMLKFMRRKDFAKMRKQLDTALPKDFEKQLKNIVLVCRKNNNLIVTCYKDNKLSNVKNYKNYLLTNDIKQRIQNVEKGSMVSRVIKTAGRTKRFDNKQLYKKYNNQINDIIDCYNRFGNSNGLKTIVAERMAEDYGISIAYAKQLHHKMRNSIPLTSGEQRVLAKKYVYKSK